MIEWLAHHLVTVYVVTAATIVIGVASFGLLWYAVPAACAVLGVATMLCRGRGTHG